EQFWQRLVEGMRQHFRNEKFSRALVEAIEEASKVLSSHFPKRSTSSGKLSDEIGESYAVVAWGGAIRKNQRSAPSRLSVSRSKPAKRQMLASAKNSVISTPAMTGFSR